MLARIRDLLRLGDSGSAAGGRFEFHDIGFHGDVHLLSLIDYIVKDRGIQCFIETGTNVGCSLAYFANHYPEIPALSCEPDKKAYRLARRNVGRVPWVTMRNTVSSQFLAELKSTVPDVFAKRTLLWLDAHGYGFDWPLREEVRFIAQNFDHAYVLIDDFKVPGMDCFGFDQYENQICAHEYVRDCFGTRAYQLYYPTYSDRTSSYHALRGWGLYVLGEEFRIPLRLQDKMSRATDGVSA